MEDASKTITIKGGLAERHLVSSERLCQLVQGFQSLVYLLASDHEKKTLNERFTVDSKIKFKYLLVFDEIKPSSVGLPCKFKSEIIEDSQLSLVPLDGELEKLNAKIYSSLEAISTNNFDLLKNQVSDSSYLKRVLNTVNEISPSKGEDWYWQYSYKNGTVKEPISVKSNTKQIIREWKHQFFSDTPAGEEKRINLQITGADLSRKIITGFYPVNSKSFDISVSVDLGLNLRLFGDENPLIQVSGIFELDGEQEPNKLVSLIDIQVPNLEPIELSDTLLGEIGLRLKENQSQVVLEPFFDEYQQFMVVEHLDLHIHSYSMTRDELIQELLDDIKSLWIEYAKENDELLSLESKTLKENLLKTFQEAIS